MRGIARQVFHISSPHGDTPSSVQTASQSYSGFCMLSNQKDEPLPSRSICRQPYKIAMPGNFVRFVKMGKFSMEDATVK
jgi:hypothetical protein